jgi:hypothetical protein
MQLWDSPSFPPEKWIIQYSQIGSSKAVCAPLIALQRTSRGLRGGATVTSHRSPRCWPKRFLTVCGYSFTNRGPRNSYRENIDREPAVSTRRVFLMQFWLDKAKKAAAQGAMGVAITSRELTSCSEAILAYYLGRQLEAGTQLWSWGTSSSNQWTWSDRAWLGQTSGLGGRRSRRWCSGRVGFR